MKGRSMPFDPHAADLKAARSKMLLTGERRDEVARILEIVAKDGLPGPRDLDAALDAIEQAFLHTSNDDNRGRDDDACERDHL
jgi:hypothetical protein